MNKTILISLALVATVFAQQGLIGLSGNNLVYTFTNRNTPAPASTVTYTGFSVNETLLSIATYPTNLGEAVYGLTTLNRIVYLNQTTNVVQVISTLTCTPAFNTNPALSIDFDPVTGSLTILTLVINSTTKTNLYTANATTGACTALPATTIVNGPPQPAGLAYVFSNPNSPFALESSLNNLTTVNVTTGALVPVGYLGSTSFSGVGGFTYNYFAKVALAALYNTTALNSNIYSVDLSSGATANIGILNVTTNLLGLASRNSGSFPAGVIGGNPPGIIIGNANAFTTTVNPNAFTTTVNPNAFTTTVNPNAFTTTVNANAFTTTVNGNAGTTTVRNGAASVFASAIVAVAALALAL